MGDAATSSQLQARLSEIDAALSGELSVEGLRALKDELLSWVSHDVRYQPFTTARQSRINLRLRALAEAANAAERPSFEAAFVASAKRLLEPAVYDIICRDAMETRPPGARVSSVSIPAPAPPPPLPPLSPAAKPSAPAEAKKPPQAAAKADRGLTAPIHRLVVAAQHRPLKFDPTTLFREFGRERVLATWNMLPAERRPETAAEFRKILARKACAP